jgi:recombination protein RecA
MSAAALAAALDKLVGNGRSIEEELVYLDSGYPPLNHALSGKYAGGFPAGKIYEISGGSSTGKTALATKLMVEAQKAGGCAIFVDWEHSFNIDLAEQFGLNKAAPFFVYIDPDTWEDGNTKALQAAQMIREAKVIPPHAPIVEVLDSIAAAIPRSMLYDSDGKEKALDEFSMNDTTALARVTSTTLKVIKRLAETHKVTLVYLNQTRTKPGVSYGDPTTTPGGTAMEFYADARIRLTRAQIKAGTGAAKEFIGQEINVKVIKSKFTAPFKTCSLRLMFNGEAAYFDVTQSMLEELAELKRIPKSTTGRYTWIDGKEYPLKTLVEKINSEGSYAELVKLLPPEEK